MLIRLEHTLGVVVSLVVREETEAMEENQEAMLLTKLHIVTTKLHKEGMRAQLKGVVEEVLLRYIIRNNILI